MRRIVISISIWALCLVATEEPGVPVVPVVVPGKCPGPEQCQFTCNTVQHSCNATFSCGCRYNFAYNLTGRYWAALGVDKIMNNGTTTTVSEPACAMDGQYEFSATCKGTVCVMDVHSAVVLCLKTINRTCDGRTDEMYILKTSNDKLGCMLLLETNESGGEAHGPLKRAVKSVEMNDQLNTSCIAVKESAENEQGERYLIQYLCDSDECHKTFDISAHIEHCKSTDGLVTLTYLQCGDNQRIKPGEQHCWFTWKRQGDELLLAGSTFCERVRHRWQSCSVYTGEEIVVLCTENCANVTDDRRDSEFCAEKIKSNQITRQAVTIVFPIFIALGAVGIVYATVSTIKKTRYAHSLIMQEYQTEFGSGKASGTEKQNKTKRKKRKSGKGKAKKGLEGPPF